MKPAVAEIAIDRRKPAVDATGEDLLSRFARACPTAAVNRVIFSRRECCERVSVKKLYGV